MVDSISGHISETIVYGHISTLLIFLKIFTKKYISQQSCYKIQQRDIILGVVLEMCIDVDSNITQRCYILVRLSL